MYRRSLCPNPKPRRTNLSLSHITNAAAWYRHAETIVQQRLYNFLMAGIHLGSCGRYHYVSCAPPCPTRVGSDRLDGRSPVEPAIWSARTPPFEVHRSSYGNRGIAGGDAYRTKISSGTPIVRFRVDGSAIRHSRGRRKHCRQRRELCPRRTSFTWLRFHLQWCSSSS